MEDVVAIVTILLAIVALVGLAAWVLVTMLSVPVGQVAVGCLLFAGGYFLGRSSNW